MYWLIIYVLIQEYDIITAMPCGYFNNPCSLMSTLPISGSTSYNVNPNPGNINVIVPGCDERISIYNRKPGSPLKNLLVDVLSLPGVAADTILSDI